MKRHLRIPALIVIHILAACSTPRTPRAPSEFLFNTDKGTSQLLEDIRAKLVENKYELKTFDTDTGFLVTQPRRFTIDRGGEKLAARQVVQIRQEGGSVKVRMIYECEYLNESGNLQFETCIVEDADADWKIRRIENLLLKIIRDNLYKRRG